MGYAILVGAIVFFVAISWMLWRVDEFTPRNYFDE